MKSRINHATQNTVAAVQAYINLYKTYKRKTDTTSSRGIRPTSSDDDDDDDEDMPLEKSDRDIDLVKGSAVAYKNQQNLYKNQQKHTNIRYHVLNDDTCQFIQHSRVYPPKLHPNGIVGAYDQQSHNNTNAWLDDNNVTTDTTQFKDWEIEEIPENDEKDTVCFISNSGNQLINGDCVISTVCNIRLQEDDDIEDVWYDEDGVIRQSNDQWYITVPVRYENGTTQRTKLFADPGANSACIDADWAMEYFPKSVAVNKDRKILATPGGHLKPKRYLTMLFPTKTGTLLQSKMYLVKDLPVKILADINMLRAFGYTFKDEIPPIFRHPAQDDLDLELKEQHEMLHNSLIKNDWYQCNIIRKQSQRLFFGTDRVNYDEVHQLQDELRGGNKVLFNAVKETRPLNTLSNDQTQYSVNSICEQEPIYGNVYADDDKYYSEDRVQDLNIYLVPEREKGEILSVQNVPVSEMDKIDDNVNNIKHALDIVNGNTDVSTANIRLYENQVKLSNKVMDTAPVYHMCLFLMSRRSFMATQEEIEQARAIHKNEKLEFPDYSYLKDYPTKYGHKYDGLYEMVMEWIEKNDDLFAKYTFDRRTMTVPPTRLGIKPEHRDKVMYAPQYPINAQKRLYYINYTEENVKNDFWQPVNWSLHCIPATLVPKKTRGVITRYRPAFDARIVNQWCILQPCHMPTLLHFKELHSKPGLVTSADIKNYFDCMPLDKRDWKYAVAQTPLGLYQMKCWTYGFMNAAPVAQTFSNQVALHVGNTLAYIDDFVIKHLLEEGTAGAKAQLDRFAEKVREYNMLLNPKKFYPCCDYAESFGFQNTMIGQMVSESYRRKMLAVAKPTTKAEIRSADGLLNYMNSHIYKSKLLMYWINKLEEVTDVKTKKKRLVWTREGNLAWEQLQHLLATLPLLHHPTIDGKFCVQTDTCNYGTGGVLWQQQLIKGKMQWVIIDMFSRVMPKQLRHCHSMIHEAWGVVTAIEHWQFYLVKREFIVSTDNEPVATIFGHCWKELAPMTQRQLIRLRTKVDMFEFSSYHVQGLKNPIADQLSRFTIELVKADNKKPTDEQQYPLTLTALEADISTNNMTVEDKEIMEQAKAEAVRLQAKMKKLQEESKNIFLLQHTPFTPQHNICNQINRTPLQKYESWQQADTRMWNQLMQDYRFRANYLEHGRITDILHSTDNNLIRDDEHSYNNEKGEQFTQATVAVLQTLTKLSPELQVHVNDEIEEEVNNHIQEQTVMFMQNVNESIVNNIVMLNKDELYDPRDDLDDLSSDDDLRKPTIRRRKATTTPKKRKATTTARKRKATTTAKRRKATTIAKRRKATRSARSRPLQSNAARSNPVKGKSTPSDTDSSHSDGSHRDQPGLHQTRPKQQRPVRTTRVMTRSQTRKQQQQKQTSKTSEEKDVYGDHGHNFQFDEMRTNIKTRQQFMQDLFGHRDTAGLLDFRKFNDYQRSDTILNLVIQLYDGEEEDWDEDDIAIIREWDPDLLDKLKQGKLKRHLGVMMVLDYDEVTKKEVLKYIVPFQVRGKLMDYMHHNLQQHHFDENHTYNAMNRTYWWSTLKKDVKRFCEHCYLCQFSKGSVRHRAPLAIREFEEPLTHIYADFLGPVYGKYHVLVLVDKTTGYCMLIPTDGCDAMTIIDSILKRWVPVFGWFTVFESDWGSGFNSKLVEAFTQLSGMKQELAEPRNHRSIGKVERVIGFLQTVIRRYNLLLDKRFTNNVIDYHEAWRVIEIILPFIQFGFNQRRPRFTTFSPNMLVFGRNMRDISDIPRLRQRLQEIQEAAEEEEKPMKNTDYRYLQELITNVERMNNIFKEDWKDYTYLSVKQYNSRWKITENKINKYKHKFKVGEQVLYFIGDKEWPMKKWRERWTGPWRVDKIINNSSLIIADITTGNQKRVSFDRIKLFNRSKYKLYNEIIPREEDYEQYHEQLLDKLKGYNVKMRKRGVELDYTN